MNELVIDASALGSVLLTDEDESLGRIALAAWSESTVRAPVHWPIEVVSILIKAERDKRISTAECDLAWDSAAVLIQTCSIEANAANSAIFSLAREHGLSAHDAAYVELASRLHIPLLTGDKKMARAAKSLSIELAFDPA